MSECERFAQVAQDKWANCSFFWANSSFSHSLTKNERFAKKNSKKSYFFTFLQFFKFFKKAKDSLISSERSERIAQVAQDKWATVNVAQKEWAIVSKLLRSLTFFGKKQAIRCKIRWANSWPWEICSPANLGNFKILRFPIETKLKNYCNLKLPVCLEITIPPSPPHKWIKWVQWWPFCVCTNIFNLFQELYNPPCMKIYRGPEVLTGLSNIRYLF